MKKYKDTQTKGVTGNIDMSALVFKGE